MSDLSFSDTAIVSCGTVSLELNHLKKEGFLDTDHLFYTPPGLHQNIVELETQLMRDLLQQGNVNSVRSYPTDQLHQLPTWILSLAMEC